MTLIWPVKWRSMSCFEAVPMARSPRSASATDWTSLLTTASRSSPRSIWSLAITRRYFTGARRNLHEYPLLAARDRLSVDDAGPGAQLGDRLDDERESVRQVIARPAIELHPVVVLAGH